MATCTQPVRELKPPTRTRMRAWLFVLLAIALPLLAGLLWHHASDNPVWPLMRNSLDRCELRDAPLSPLSPDGSYRVHVVQATCFGRFSETLVFVTDAADPWSLASINPDHAVLEIAGLRSLDAIDWQETADEHAPILQLWIAPRASSHQIHRIERIWHTVTIQPRTSADAGAGRFDY